MKRCCHSYQVVQSSHQGFKLVVPDAALVQGAEGGAGPAHGAGGAGLMGAAVQQNQVLFASGTA